MGQPTICASLQSPDPPEHRDTQAIHAKLDELLKVHSDAKNSLMAIDDKDAEEVEREREKVRAS